MSCSDPIADMLTVIRNGLLSNKRTVTVTYSRIKEGICQVLLDEGYITRFDVLDTLPARTIQVGLKYGPAGEKVINTIKRVSTPGRRVYAGYKKLSPVINGFGISILSTSKGVMSDRACRQAQIGGEVLCLIK